MPSWTWWTRTWRVARRWWVLFFPGDRVVRFLSAVFGEMGCNPVDLRCLDNVGILTQFFLLGNWITAWKFLSWWKFTAMAVVQVDSLGGQNPGSQWGRESLFYWSSFVTLHYPAVLSLGSPQMNAIPFWIGKTSVFSPKQNQFQEMFLLRFAGFLTLKDLLSIHGNAVSHLRKRKLHRVKGVKISPRQ